MYRYVIFESQRKPMTARKSICCESQFSSPPHVCLASPPGGEPQRPLPAMCAPFTQEWWHHHMTPVQEHPSLNEPIAALSSGDVILCTPEGRYQPHTDNPGSVPSLAPRACPRSQTPGQQAPDPPAGAAIRQQLQHPASYPAHPWVPPKTGAARSAAPPVSSAVLALLPPSSTPAPAPPIESVQRKQLVFVHIPGHIRRQ